MYVSDTMAVPPAYSDLGKAAKDIFSKGYGKNFVSVMKNVLSIACLTAYFSFFRFWNCEVRPQDESSEWSCEFKSF